MGRSARKQWSTALIVVAAVWAGSCTEPSESTLHVEDLPGCDALVPAHCAYPYPSMAGLEADPSSATGFRSALVAEALPAGTFDAEDLLERWNEADGFSISTPFVTVFADDDELIDRSSLPAVEDLEASLAPDASVQVFDRETGERYPVWAETDVRADEPEEQALIIRPMKALPFGRRVAVAVTDGLRLEGGGVPTAPAPFEALRDGRPTDSEAFEARREDAESLFAFLEDQGLERDRLLLAWETVTASEGFVVDPLPTAVDAAVAAFDAANATYRVTACYAADEADRTAFGCEAQEGDDRPLNPRTWRRVYGEVELPGLLDADGLLVRDGDGMPQVSGTFTAEFVVNVPVSLRDAPAGSALTVVFGHGLLVEPARYLADEDDSEGQMELAERMGAVFVGTRWYGLSSTEVDLAGEVIVDFGGSFAFHDALLQGIVNQVLMAPFATGALADEPLLGASDGSGSLLDTSEVFYTGISLGGIFGTTLMAVSPFVETGVLHVPASGFAHMLPHSADFSAFQLVLDAVYDPLDQQLMIAMAQRLFDVGDPINYIHAVVDQPLTELGPKSCLWQCAIGDTEAMWYGCDMLVRTGGFPLAAPEVSPVLGLATIDTPTAPATSAMQQYDPGLGMPALDAGRVEPTGAHRALRRNPEVQLQTMDYLDPSSPGRIVNHCGGPCAIDPVPEPGE